MFLITICIKDFFPISFVSVCVCVCVCVGGGGGGGGGQCKNTVKIFMKLLG